MHQLHKPNRGGAANKNIGDAFLLVWKLPRGIRARELAALSAAAAAEAASGGDDEDASGGGGGGFAWRASSGGGSGGAGGETPTFPSGAGGLLSGSGGGPLVSGRVPAVQIPVMVIYVCKLS